jgi:NAD(P)-dependent dehydrogenase (short-subunit alcohol dehydrogenase family)
MHRLEGRVAIITGAASGIGEAAAHRLAAEGAITVVTDIDAAGATTAADAITAAGGNAIPMSCDVRDRTAINRVVDEVVSTHGRLDIMVNNAGVDSIAPLALLDEAHLSDLVEINLLGVIHGTAAAGRVMMNSGSGAIINTASVAAAVGMSLQSIYCATKGGVVSFTRAAACELAPRIRVNAVAPGGVRTPIVEKLLGGTPNDDVMRAMARLHLLNRLGHPSEVAAVIAFLASDDASFMTGTTITVDGGMTAGLPIDLNAAMTT